MRTVVLARGDDPGLLSQRAWRRLQAGSLWVDPTVSPALVARLPPGRVPRDEATVLVVNEALRDLRGEAWEFIPDLPPLLAEAGPLDARWDGPVTLVDAEPPDWDALADTGGVLLLTVDAEGLEEAGLPPDVPRRSLPHGTLVGPAPAPSTARPLAGRRIVVTRAADQAGDLADRLEDLGAQPVLLPTIRIEDTDPALGDLSAYDWLIFTSPNAPRRFLQRLLDGGRDARALRAHIACIGPSTAKALKACHLQTDLLPDEYVAEGLLRAFEAHEMQGRRVLLARAEEARDVLPDGLRARGATVDIVPIYRTVPVDRFDVDLSRVDLVTLTASSVARSFHALTAGQLPPETTRVLAIGPITAATARDLGYAEVHVAEEYTVDGLLAAAVRILAGP